MSQTYRLLPPIVINDQNCHLPVSAGVLYRVAANSGNAGEIGRILAECPTLLLFACHSFHEHKGIAASDGQELGSWFAERGLGLLQDLPTEPANEAKWFSKFQLVYQFEFGKSKKRPVGKTNKRFRKRLLEIVKACSNVKRRCIKRWLKQVVGKELTQDNFACELKVHGKAGSTEDSLRSMLRIASELDGLKTEFADRLLNEKLAAMKELAYGASHEINNPLANIATRAQALLKGEPNPERRRKLSIVFEQSMRAHEMITDLMLFAHPPVPHFELTDLYTLAKQVASEMRPWIRQRNASVDVRTYPNVRKASVDSGQIAVALKAIIKNSLESFDSLNGENMGRVVVRVWSPDDSSVAISVTDNGSPVSERASKHMFDPFFSGREAGRGLGFGLSKAWRILELHHGSVRWNEQFEKGTQYFIQIPVQQPNCARIDKDCAA